MLPRLFHIVIAMLLWTLPASAGGTAFAGSVTYAERFALPEAGTLTVTLVSLPAGTAIASATAAIEPRSRPPFTFTLNVRSDLSRHASLGLTARLQAGSFALATPNPVPASPAVPISLGLVPVAPVEAAAPAEFPPLLPAADLVDVLWRITSIGGKPTAPGRAPTFSITADGRAGGNSGCNNYFAEADFADGVAFGPPAATRMACPQPLMEQEASLFAALVAVAGYQAEDNSLRLLDAAGVPLIGLVRMENQ